MYQVHDAVSALVQSWWLNGRASAALLDRTAENIEYHQQRNAVATKAHTKKTIQKLHGIGMLLTQIKRCYWDST